MPAKPAASRTSPVQGALLSGKQRYHRPHLPAGSIKHNSPAGQYLIAHGVTPADFNSYGSRRGNHEVMMRARLPTCVCATNSPPHREGATPGICRTAKK